MIAVMRAGTAIEKTMFVLNILNRRSRIKIARMYTLNNRAEQRAVGVQAPSHPARVPNTYYTV